MIVNIIGAGTWGTSLGYLLHKNNIETTIYCKNEKLLNSIIAKNKHINLPDFIIPKNMTFTSDFDSLNFNNLNIIATPSNAIANFINNIPLANSKFIIASKGFEITSKSVTYELLVNKYSIPKSNIAVISGPNHAEEIIQDKPAATVIAGFNSAYAKKLQRMFASSNFRVYTSKDCLGVQIGAAIKNIIAIASGICDGLDYGDNIKAALVSRGMKEILTFGEILNVDRRTLYGLSGLGDLIATCYSKHSRNRKFGEYLGENLSMDASLKKVGMVVEGINSTIVVNTIKRKHNLSMPICTEINNILFDKSKPKESINKLMNRSLINES